MSALMLDIGINFHCGAIKQQRLAWAIQIDDVIGRLIPPTHIKMALPFAITTKLNKNFRLKIKRQAKDGKDEYKDVEHSGDNLPTT